jgi:PRC-barrel domain
LLLGSAVTAMLGAAPLSALAGDAIPSNAPIQLAQDQSGGAADAADTAADSVGVTTDSDSALTNPDGSLNASKLIGLDVQSAQDEKVGDIGEVVVSKDGQVEGVVVDVGGFLGIATHPVLLDWKDVNLTSENGTDRAVVNLNKERLEQMPAYQSSSR